MISNRLVVGFGLAGLAWSAVAAPKWHAGLYASFDSAPIEMNLLRQPGTSCTGEPNYYTQHSMTLGNTPAKLTDGIVPEEAATEEMCAITQGAFSWRFAQAARLASVAVYTRWVDGGRDGIYITGVEVQRTPDGSWERLMSVPLDIGRNDNYSAGAYKAVLEDDSGEDLAAGVFGLRLLFGPQDNWGTGYVEIEAIGSLAAGPKFSLAPATVGTRTVEFAGTVTDCADAEEADFYFAFGKTAPLEPERRGTYEKGDTLSVSLGELEPNTTYCYAAYLQAGDQVSPTFTGSFRTKREVRRNLPSDYTQVASLTSVGGAYVRTGVATDTDLAAFLDFAPHGTTGDVSVGSEADDNADWRFFNYEGGAVFDVGTGRLGMVNSAVSSGGTKLTDGTRYLVEFGRDPAVPASTQFFRICDVTGKELYRASAPTQGHVRRGETVALFGGLSGTTMKPVAMTVYAVTLHRGTRCVGDFVPCVRNTDKTPGLYDLVTRRFHPNANPAPAARFTFTRME